MLKYYQVSPNKSRKVTFGQYYCQFMCNTDQNVKLSLKIISLVILKSYLVINSANLCEKFTSGKIT